MNFVVIFFQLLITGMFYIRGFCPNPIIEYTVVLSRVEVSDEQNSIILGNFESTYIHKYKNEDSFFMHDLDNATLFEDIIVEKLFSSEQLEFVTMYQLQLLFSFQNAQRHLYVMCLFSNKKGIQKFFDSVNSQKPKNEAIEIHKIARYTSESDSNSTPQIELFAEKAELSVRYVTNSMGVLKYITYYISHKTSTDGKVEADLIFPATKFSISPLYSNNTIALCVEDISNVYFIIRFSNEQNPKKFIKDHMEGMHNDKKCTFPHLSSEMINHLNN